MHTTPFSAGNVEGVRSRGSSLRARLPHAQTLQQEPQFLGCVETRLALLSRLARAVLVWTRLPVPLPVEKTVQHPVVAGAEPLNAIILPWELRTAISDRRDVMKLEHAHAVTSQVCQSALGVVREAVPAVVPPGLGVVQSRHWLSPQPMLPTPADVKPSDGAVFT